MREIAVLSDWLLTALSPLSWPRGHGGLTVLGTNCLPPNHYVGAAGAPTVAEFGNREVIKGK